MILRLDWMTIHPVPLPKRHLNKNKSLCTLWSLFHPIELKTVGLVSICLFACFFKISFLPWGTGVYINNAWIATDIYEHILNVTVFFPIFFKLVFLHWEFKIPLFRLSFFSQLFWSLTRSIYASEIMQA